MCTLTAVYLLFLFCIHIEGESGSIITSVKNVSIECKSERYGVVVKFQEQKSSDYIRLAECQFGPDGYSQLMDETFKRTYDVTYVNYTSILIILYLTAEQCGMYTCSEMFNESETNMKQIGWSCEDVTRFTETTDSHCTPIIVCISVGCFVLAGVVAAFVVHLRRKKKPKTSNEYPQELQYFSEAEPLKDPHSEADEESSPCRIDLATDPNKDSVGASLVSCQNLIMTAKDTLTVDITQDDGSVSFKSKSVQNNTEQESPGQNPVDRQENQTKPTKPVPQQKPRNTSKLPEVRRDPEKEIPVEEQEKQTTPTKTVHQRVESFEMGEATQSQSRNNSEVQNTLHQLEL